ncbi:polyketide synthase 2 [Pyrenophora tritici-repentis]|nr:polyketide synthase 2 [Pyrenophora tritici-repentis]
MLAEAVNCLIVKRLADAIRNRDPIRAVVRSTASNSNGRTVGGIVSPNSVAQATAIRTAYARAGISDFNETAYLECHGTGTPAGDAAEVNGAGSVFGRTRDTARPLLIGSIKSNLGHAEPAAGISGVIKVILSMEENQIPGTPTFIKPSPKIDFSGNRVKASRRVIAWPNQGYSVKRASVSSSGFGGSNAHAVIEQHTEMGAGKTYAHSYQTGFADLEDDDDASELPSVLVLSANDATALKVSINALCNHLINPAVRTPMPDLAYTLSERRSRFFHRAFVTTTSSADLDDGDFVVSKKLSHESKTSLVFTGQGAQWPQMGEDLLRFPLARSILKELDEVLQAQPNPPAWTLLAELTEPRSVDHLRQPLMTTLQLCLFALFKSWGITPKAVFGHSSGEIAAVYAADHLDLAGAIKAAFYRGRAAVNPKDESESDVGMLAVGLGPEGVAPFMKKYFQIGRNIWIACFNSPSSVTVSGNKPTLEALAADIKASGHFARLLHVDLAYHSPMMDVIGDEYSKLLASDEAFRPLSGNTDAKVAMFSSVTASELNGCTDADYWKSNMVSPVRFAEALTQLVANESPDIIIELDPAGALAGPISQILKDKALESSRDVVYWASWARGAESAKGLLTAAGRLFNAGAPIDICKVNRLDMDKMRILVDLPSYPWNHSVNHDLIGSKVLGTSWTAPTWRKQLRLSDVPWLRDHTLGSDVLLPGAAFAAIALESMYQKHCALYPDETENVTRANDLSYRFRNIKLDRAVVVEDSKPTTVLLTLTGVPGSKDWHEFRVRTTADDVVYEHCCGMIRVQEALADDETSRSVSSAPLRHPQAAGLWYKRQDETGTHFGPSFQKIKHFEAVSGRRDCRAALDLTPPPSRWDSQSYYPLHPAALDACFQSSIPAVVGGECSALREVLVPAQIDDMVINKMPRQLQKGMAAAEATWSGRGRKEKNQTWTASSLHWKPDISLLSQDQLLYMDPSGAEGTLLDDIIDLVAHKTPRLKVLEIAIDIASTADPLWLHNSSGSGVRAARVACAHYDFATSEAQTLVAVQSAHNGHARDFHLLHANQDALGLPATEPTYDLAIVRGPTKTSDGIIDKITSLLKPCGVLLRVPDESDVESANGSGVQRPSSSSGEALSETSEGSGFLMVVPGIPAAWLSIKAHTRTVAADDGPLLVLQFDDSSPTLAPGLRTVLTAAGWKLKTASVSKFSDVSHAVAQAAAVLVVDEMAAPVLENISERRWEALKQVALSRKPLVWVTKGSQTAERVTDPDRALVHGLFRTFRREELGARLTTLDVQSAASPAAHRAVERVLTSTYSHPETWDGYEYAERDGVLLVPRLMVDNELNAFKAASGGTGLEPITKGLHSTNDTVRLRAEVVGSLQKLVWSETVVSDLPLADTSVEVEVVAVGANFKDVATAMGIVPENEYMLGFECSGTVRRVGAGAASRFRPGDRVVAHTNGSYANRVQTSADRVHAIPDTMSFEDAATIPVVYVTVVYSLFHLAHLRQGQSILIHSAAGGIFVTVGSDEKRELLMKEFGISPDRIFSSRNIGFADAIWRATNGCSRLTADGGTIVEISKRDIVDRNTLAMEPFNHNCSFRAVDLSYTPDISDALIAKLLAEVFDLVNAGHIGPVHPVTVYGFDQVIDALSEMRSGKHMGKIAISSGTEDVQLPIRPAVRELELKADATYVLVGGLKGACGSLDVHMARHGARHLSSLSRSGMGDKGSAKIVEHCASYGCEVTEAKGDVGDLAFVSALFRSVQHGYIAGVIQGAMVTRDKPYELMTHDDYHTAIHAKVRGTWNLHLAAQQEQKQPLDFFSLLSSVSGVTGMKV